MLELEELKRLHDKAYNHNNITRERASDDLTFYWLTAWDDQLLGESTLQYRGEFNIIRRAGRQVMGDLRANPVQVDFQPVDEGRDDGADLLDGLYRADDRLNTSMESYGNASSETIVCGYGAWELYTEYKSMRSGNEDQVIRRRPIYEANNNCLWDPDAKLQDKSDADFVSILVPYTHDGYQALVKELTGVDEDVDYASFANPEQSYTFPWAAGENEAIYVSRFYHRKKIKDRVIHLTDPLGNPITMLAGEFDDLMDDLDEAGYNVSSEKDIERWEVTLYIASGAEILKEYTIPGEHIPVVPVYGERAYVEGEEHYEGVTRLAKDPQRLRNFQMSYLADIVSRSPRPKPVFFPEQIQGFEFMYQETGPDNNFPFLYQNRVTQDGQPLPVGPASQLPEQQVPQALIASINLSREAVGDVAPANVPQDIADVDLSGKAVAQLQNRLDEQSIVYQQNMKHAKRRDGEIYASMASEVYDAPRRVNLTLPNGERKSVMIMQAVFDKDAGDMKVLNDLTNTEFEVFADIGPSFTTKKEQTIEVLGGMAQAVAATDPNLQKALVLKQIQLVDGVNMDDIREYATRQLVLSGFKEPETEEEMALLQNAQQNAQPDPALLLAQAEMTKGQAQLAETERKTLADQLKASNDAAKTQIDAFRAQTDRFAVEVDAEEAGASINLKNMQALNNRVDAQVKATERFRARLG